MPRRLPQGRGQRGGRGDPLIDDHRIRGQVCRDRLADLFQRDRARRQGRDGQRDEIIGLQLCLAQVVGQRLQGPGNIHVPAAQVDQPGVRVIGGGRPAGIGKEPGGAGGPAQDQRRGALQQGKVVLDPVGHPLDPDRASPAPEPGGKERLHQPRPRRLGQTLGQQPKVGPQRRAIHQQHRARQAQGLGGGGNLAVQGTAQGGRWRGNGLPHSLSPRHVGGQDQRRDPAVPGPRRLHRIGGIAGHPARFRTDPRPVRHRPGYPHRVALQRGLEPQVIVGMVTHDVQDARLRLPGVVQVGKGIAETGGQVQQRRRDLALHPEIPIRRAGHAALEQAQDAAHVGVLVQGGDKVHFRGAGIGETDPYVAGKQGPHQCFRAVHVRPPLSSCGD